MNIKALILVPVTSTIVTIVWLALFSFGIGTINSLYLQNQAAGEIGSERLDRIVAKQSADQTADDRWGLVTDLEDSGSSGSLVVHTAATTQTTSYTIYDSGTDDECAVSEFATTGVTAFTAYTPQGTEVTVGTNGRVNSCDWEVASPVLTRGTLSGLIAMLLQVAGLGGPVMLIVAVGSIGGSIGSMAGGGSGWQAVLVAIGTVIALVVLVALFAEIVPFLSDAYLALTELRFAMFESGIGRVSVLIGDFLGVTAIGAIGGAIWGAWSNWKRTSGGGSGYAQSM